MEYLLGLLPLDLYIRSVAMGTCYRLFSTGGWRNRGERTSHTRIWNVTGAEVPITTMYGDNTVPYFSFDHQFETLIPTRDQWEEADAPVVPEGAIIVYTDGSSELRGTGRGQVSSLMDCRQM